MQTYAFPTAIVFGPGARRALLPDLAARGLARPLLVTDEGLAALPVFRSFAASLADGGAAAGVFSGVRGNPRRAQVTAGVEAFRDHDADAVIAFGGGAAMDVAKAIALMLHHPGDIFDYEDGRPDAPPVDGPLPHLVAIPTTAGTGSEVGRSAVISEDDTGVKRVIFAPRLLPVQALIDPELTLGLPASITATTGMDALTHCVEAYLATGDHPMCDGIAWQGVRLVADSLAACVGFARGGGPANAPHLEARGRMMQAAFMGAVAFQKGLGVNHSVAHALSAVAGLHHGLANAVLLPWAMEYNAPACAARLTDLALAARLPAPGPEAFIAWLRGLRAQIGIPADLAAAGVTDEQLDALVDGSLADGCHATNPRPVSRADLVELIGRAFRGEV